MTPPPPRKLGQHFLIDERVLARIISYAKLKKFDKVLEIGAGAGNLTAALAEKAGKVYAIEWDRKLAETLENRKIKNVKVICGDALKVDFPKFNNVVANLPYSISSDITFKLLRHDFRLGILMYQYEFAKRMIANAGTKDYSRLSVAVQYFAKVRILETVPRTAFYPMPEVRSAIVEVIPSKADYGVADEGFFFKFITALFTQRRKKLKSAVNYAADMLDINLQDFDFPRKDERVEKLSPRELAELANAIYKMAQK
jgi:16S rRNA (adenine1518-N6/adenine1519-N6)-dimethyltransferase